MAAAKRGMVGGRYVDAGAERRAKRRTQARKDPKAHRLSGVMGDELIRRDPDKHYVLAYIGHAETGVESYRRRGYEVVRWTPEGVGVAGVEPNHGEPIEVRGHVLMECTKAHREELEDYGESGQTGQDIIDRIEDMILDVKKPTFYDPQRGLYQARVRNKYFSIVDERGATDDNFQE